MGHANRWQDAPDGHEALRVYEPRGVVGDGGLSAEMTLREFVAAYYKPVYLVGRDARARHLEEIDQSVKYWCRFTGDPPLGATTVFDCRDFVVGLKSLPGRRYATLARNTVRKHAAAIQAILDLAGPPSRDAREAVGLLESVPYVTRPRKESTSKLDDRYTLDEAQRILAQTHVARLPDSLPCSAGDYFARLIVVWFHTGMRPGGTMGAGWRGYHGDHLWLRARVAAKGFEDKRFELNACAREAIELMRGADAERIFPWPRSWPASRKQFYTELRRILAAALPTERRFAAYGFRRLHTDEMDGIDPTATRLSLGHTTEQTTNAHYRGRRLVAQTVAKLPALRAGCQRQLRLFE